VTISTRSFGAGATRSHTSAAIPSTRIAQIFAQEQPRLLPLPAHPFDTAVTRIVASAKTPSVHFDRNDYSIPHTHRQQPLTLIATPTTVRLIVGTDEEIASHPRSYDTGQTIEQEDHVAGPVAAAPGESSSARDRLRLRRAASRSRHCWSGWPAANPSAATPPACWRCSTTTAGRNWPPR
jgi:hypothetical protein